MKTMLLLSFALLFGCTIFAQSPDAPNSPYATYSCEKMKPDNFHPSNWYLCEPDVSPLDGLPALPRPIRIISSTVVDADAPNAPVVKYKAEKMKPEGIYPNRAFPDLNKKLPY